MPLDELEEQLWKALHMASYNLSREEKPVHPDILLVTYSPEIYVRRTIRLVWIKLRKPLLYCKYVVGWVC